MDLEYQRQVSLGFGRAQTCLSHSWDQVSSHAMVHDASTLRFWGVEFIGWTMPFGTIALNDGN
jgi:hypothetical protein